MRPHALPPLFTLILLAHLALAQQTSTTLLPGDPPCAQTCSILVQAQSACVPPAAQPASQDTYKSCFCQSAFLGPLRSTPQQNLCAGQCPDSDWGKVTGWFEGFCGGGGANGGGNSGGGGQTTTSTQAAGPTSSASSSAAGSSATGAAASQSNANVDDASAAANYTDGKSWYAYPTPSSRRQRIPARLLSPLYSISSSLPH